MNEIVRSQERQLTEKQEALLDAIFETGGNVSKAAEMAGYTYHAAYKALKTLREQVIERAELILAAHSPKAVNTIIDKMDGENALEPGSKIQIDAAKTLLDRIGISKRERLEIDQTIKHGIFILPAKEELLTIDEEGNFVSTT